MDDEGIDQSGQSGLLRIDIPTSTSTYERDYGSSTPREEGFDINDFTGKEPLTDQKKQELKKEFLCRVEYGDVQGVLDLIAVGADVNAIDESGNYFVGFQRCSALHKAKSIEMAKLLVEAGADVNAVDAEGNTPLHKAKSIEMAKLLVEAGADVNAVDVEGNTPLHKEKSSQITHQPLPKKLAQKVINIINHFQGRIAEIMRDAQVGDPLYSDKVELFIKHGADIGRVNQKGETPLDYRLKRKLTVVEEGSEAEE